MNVLASSDIPEDKAGANKIGRIPVRNLWLLMLYASDLFRHLDSAKIAIEENPDDIPDLVAEILTSAVEQRIRRNLSFGYQTRKANLGRVRGRINLLDTERHRLLDRGMVSCRFDELTVDTPRNRYVRAALNEISKLVRKVSLVRRCRSLASSLRLMGVVGERPVRTDVSVDQFGRHDIQEQKMVAAAHLAFNLALPTEAAGLKHLSLPEREITWVRKLFEKGIAGFYNFSLSVEGWSVHAGKTIGWPIEGKTAGIDKILPGMRTDIVLENLGKSRRIVIDTKFNSIVTKGWYKDETLRSAYLYQIYAYLRSQENHCDELSGNSIGMLLHPSVGDMVYESVTMQGHEIRFATVDLSTEAEDIRSQLLEVVNIPDANHEC